MSVNARYNAKDVDYTHVTAVYENGEMKQIFMQEGSADSNSIIQSEQSFEIDKDIDLSKCTVKSFLLNGIDKLVPYMPAEKISRSVEN